MPRLPPPTCSCPVGGVGLGPFVMRLLCCGLPAPARHSFSLCDQRLFVIERIFLSHAAHSHCSTIPPSETDVNQHCVGSGSGPRASDLRFENFSLGRERGLTADRSVQRAQRCGTSNQRKSYFEQESRWDTNPFHPFQRVAETRHEKAANKPMPSPHIWSSDADTRFQKHLTREPVDMEPACASPVCRGPRTPCRMSSTCTAARLYAPACASSGGRTSRRPCHTSSTCAAAPRFARACSGLGSPGQWWGCRAHKICFFDVATPAA